MHLATASRLMGLGFSNVIQVEYANHMTPAVMDTNGNPSIAPVIPTIPAACGMGPYLPGTACDQAATAAAAAAMLAEFQQGPLADAEAAAESLAAQRALQADYPTGSDSPNTANTPSPNTANTPNAPKPTTKIDTQTIVIGAIVAFMAFKMVRG